MLTDDMKRVVEEQRLGFVATVCPDGTPNLSPKGTTAVWDDDRLDRRRGPAALATSLHRPSQAFTMNIAHAIVTLERGRR